MTNEAPEILKKALVVVGDRSVGYAENGTGSVAEYSAAGPNTANLRWRLTGADASDFSINSSGVLTFRSSPNYESPADANRDNTYEVSVTGSSGNIQDTLLVTVDVANVDEEGSVTLSPTRGSVGGQITATLNDADGQETNVAWAWERSQNGVTGWSIISGATSATYRSGTVDIGHFLRASATYTDSEGPGKSASAATTAAILADDDGTVTLSPSRLAVGETVTARLTDPDGNVRSVTWQWSSSSDGVSGWSDIAGATAATYRPVALDIGVFLRATASYDDGDGTGKSAERASTTAVAEDDDGSVTLSTVRPQLGDAITATVTDPDGGVTGVAWRWASSSDGTTGWVNISGATSATYAVVSADIGNFLRATASYTDSAGSGKSAEGVSSVAVVEDDDGSVTLSPSSPQVGDTVTATITDPDGGVTGATWQWASSSDGTTGWTNILGTTSATYTVVDANVGNFLRASVNYDDAAGTGKSAEAVTSAAVTEDDDGSVTLSPASPEVGDTVTARLSDPDGGVTGATWQWASSSNGTTNWIPILGTTSATYTVVEANVGNYLRATASYDDSVGDGKSAEAVTSSAVSEDDDGTVTLSTSEPEVFRRITATLSDRDGGVTNVSWQWARSTNGSTWTDITGAICVDLHSSTE